MTQSRAATTPVDRHHEEASWHAIKPSGPFDIAFLGSPCQPFCHAGKHISNDSKIGITINGLRLAVRTRAFVIVMENVPGIVRNNGGTTWSWCLEILSGARYRIYHHEVEELVSVLHGAVDQGKHLLKLDVCGC